MIDNSNIAKINIIKKTEQNNKYKLNEANCIVLIDCLAILVTTDQFFFTEPLQLNYYSK